MTGKDTNILRKTPEEIKKGLECAMPRNCNGHKCSTCPNATYSLHELLKGDLIKDTFDYIEQLEQRLAQVERERDAAVTLIGKLIVILKKYPNAATNMCAYDAYMEIKKYLLDMRGVCEENSKEENNG